MIISHEWWDWKRTTGNSLSVSLQTWIHGSRYTNCVAVILRGKISVHCMWMELTIRRGTSVRRGSWNDFFQSLVWKSKEVCINETEDVQVRGFEWQEVDVAVRRGKLGKAAGLDMWRLRCCVLCGIRFQNVWWLCTMHVWRTDVLWMCGRKRL